MISSNGPAAVRYLELLWAHRLMIALVSVIPAAAVATLLTLWPAKYTATFVYERQLSESQHSVLLRRFFSQENLDKIVRRLDEQGLADYAGRLDKARVRQSFDKLVRFEVSPIYPKRLQTTDPTTSAQISAFQARLLSIKVIGDSEQQVLKAGAIMTDNVESILPLYDIRNELKESIQRYQLLAAQVEDNRFALTVDLQTEQAKLEKLKALDGATAQGPQANIVLQFTDVKNSSEFLPLSSQILAVQSRIIGLQETLASDTEKYGFYLKVLDLNDKLLKQIEESFDGYTPSSSLPPQRAIAGLHGGSRSRISQVLHPKDGESDPGEHPRRRETRRVSCIEGHGQKRHPGFRGLPDDRVAGRGPVRVSAQTAGLPGRRLAEFAEVRQGQSAKVFRPGRWARC